MYRCERTWLPPCPGDALASGAREFNTIESDHLRRQKLLLFQEAQMRNRWTSKIVIS